MIKRIKIGTILLSVVLMFMVCQAKKDIPELRESRLEVDREFSILSIETGTDEAFFRFMVEEGIVLPRQGNPIKGKASFRKVFEQLPDIVRTSRLEWEPERAGVSEPGDLESTFGRYIQTVSDTQGAVETTLGFCVTIWKIQAEGSWKFVSDTGNEPPSPVN